MNILSFIVKVIIYSTFILRSIYIYNPLQVRLSRNWIGEGRGRSDGTSAVIRIRDEPQQKCAIYLYIPKTDWSYHYPFRLLVWNYYCCSLFFVRVHKCASGGFQGISSYWILIGFRSGLEPDPIDLNL